MESLTDDDRRLLKGKNFGHLVTLMPDGAPHVTPMWIDVSDDGHLLINTAEGRTKVRNMAADPRVALSVEDADDPYSWISVQGEVVSSTTEGAGDHIDELSMRYQGTKYPWGRDDRILYRIRPDHIARGN